MLNGVDLVIPDLGPTVVVGPSGSGKTTLLRLCNRLDVPTSGSIRFKGRPLDSFDVLSLRHQIGMVFQRPTPFPGTVGDNLRVAVDDIDRSGMVELLRRAELEGSFLDRDVSGLSGGEAQRMCLARTLAVEPSVVLMDEPTASLDEAPKRQLERLASRLVESGVMVLWVTHELAQAQRLGGHVVVVLEGRVAGTGTVDEIVGREGPASIFLSGGLDAG